VADIPWRWLGRSPYAPLVEEMERRRADILAGDESAAAVLLCEHEPVITLGRAARPEHVLLPAALLADRGVEVARSSRGGDVTYHGPGQLMVYPVVRLHRGVVAHLELVFGVLAGVAAELGAPGARFRRDPAGLWLGDRKLAACGLHVRRGVAIHGFAFDVSTPPEAWSAIVPCGLREAPVISLARALGPGAAVPAVVDIARRVGPRLSHAIAMSAPASTMQVSAPSSTAHLAASSSSTTPTTTKS
jgi:lipoyl(octanoyl) transferase